MRNIWNPITLNLSYNLSVLCTPQIYTRNIKAMSSTLQSNKRVLVYSLFESRNAAAYKAMRTGHKTDP